jgi:hypothetical protein
LRGASVRVVGLLLLCLAGSALADERTPSSLTRFAYAGPLAFQTSFASTQDSVSDVGPSYGVAGSEPRPRALRFVSAEDLLGQSLVTGRTETTVPKTRPSRSRIRQSVAAKRIEPIAPLREIPLLPVPRSRAQHLAALSEPMHLLADAPPAAIVASEDKAAAAARAQAHEHAPAARTHSWRRSRTRTAWRTSKAKANAKPWKVPRWAEKMFEGPWQRHAFAYQ